MPRRPSLNSLRLFMQIAYNRSFSETGRIANVSQPALSRTIRILEEELGVRLFDRNSRNVSLTSAGEALLPIVERLTADFDHAFSELSLTFSGDRGRVVIGTLPSIAASILPPIIASFLALHPQVEIILNDNLSATIYQQMHDRQIDLAIAGAPPDDEIRFDPVMEDTMLFVGPEDSSQELGATVEWSVFATKPFIAMAQRSSVRGLTDRGLQQAGITVTPHFECTQLATVAALIEAGLGVTALPKSTIPMIASRRIVTRPLTGQSIELRLGIAYDANRTMAPAADAFRRHFLAEAGATTR
jgi:LysR family carnitine catabolism transcriptional activator